MTYDTTVQHWVDPDSLNVHTRGQMHGPGQLIVWDNAIVRYNKRRDHCHLEVDMHELDVDRDNEVRDFYAIVPTFYVRLILDEENPVYPN